MTEGVFPPHAAGRFSAGSRIARYRLEGLIGRGGMAEVFRAWDERLDRRVALKILGPELAEDPVFRERFIRESRAAAVQDPHIIPVFEAGEASGVLFIAMPLIDGGDAGSFVRRNGRLPPARAAEIVSQVASALDAAHAKGLVHRDVKPANMLLDVRPGVPDHVYLSDFGLTKALLDSGGLTAAGQFLGTLDYAAPIRKPAPSVLWSPSSRARLLGLRTAVRRAAIPAGAGGGDGARAPGRYAAISNLRVAWADVRGGPRVRRGAREVAGRQVRHLPGVRRGIAAGAGATALRS